MNSRNLYVIFWGGIFLSMLPEMIFQPVTQLALFGVKHRGMQRTNESETTISPDTSEESSPTPNATETEASHKPHTRPKKITTTPAAEITMNLAYSKDDEDYLNKHPWSKSYGNRQQDKRFTLMGGARVNVASNPDKQYQPNDELSTVCMGSTIPYGKYKVINWVIRHNYRNAHGKSAIFLPLRGQIFKKGKSEACHDMQKYGNWIDYHSCALRRNQRMEGLLPKYPLQQYVRDHNN